MLDDGLDHFESSEDIYEAIGEMLLQGQENFTQEKEIQDICALFYSVMKGWAMNMHNFVILKQTPLQKCGLLLTVFTKWENLSHCHTRQPTYTCKAYTKSEYPIDMWFHLICSAENGNASGSMRILDAPVNLGSLAGDMVKATAKYGDTPQIMLAKKEGVVVHIMQSSFSWII